MKKLLCVVILLCLFGVSEAGQQRRISVVIFPTINSTGLEVWESKYYPYNVLEQKMSNYLEELFKRSPLIEARVLDEAAMNRWLSGSRRGDDMAVQIELYSALLKDRKTVLLDTRKTTPNMRIFEKYAVKCGGGQNHRYNLSDGILLKDNHIGAAGSITKAIEMAKAYAPFVRKIEIETETLDQVKEAVEAGADIIMLDNMDVETMKKAVEIIDGRAKTECSGNVTKENIKNIIDSGVDYVSSGALTHSAPILDISMKNLHAV